MEQTSSGRLLILRTPGTGQAEIGFFECERATRRLRGQIPDLKKSLAKTLSRKHRGATAGATGQDALRWLHYAHRGYAVNTILPTVEFQSPFWMTLNLVLRSQFIDERSVLADQAIPVIQVSNP